MARPVNVSERLLLEIAGLISVGKLRPGDALPSEHEMMRKFGVGRSSVREALKGLSLVGILATKPKRGTVVVSTLDGSLADELAKAVTYWEISDLYRVRMLLEGEGAALAAERATEQDLAAIQRAQKAMTKAIAAEASHFDTNSRFHISIAKAAHSTALLTCVSAIISSYRGAREQINQLESVPADDIIEHLQIIEAIRRRDASEARWLMQAHLRTTILRLEEPKVPLARHRQDGTDKRQSGRLIRKGRTAARGNVLTHDVQ